jgi:hypothetical protein
LLGPIQSRSPPNPSDRRAAAQALHLSRTLRASPVALGRRTRACRVRLISFVVYQAACRGTASRAAQTGFSACVARRCATPENYAGDYIAARPFLLAFQPTAAAFVYIRSEVPPGLVQSSLRSLLLEEDTEEDVDPTAACKRSVYLCATACESLPAEVIQGADERVRWSGGTGHLVTLTVEGRPNGGVAQEVLWVSAISCFAGSKPNHCHLFSVAPSTRLHCRGSGSSVSQHRDARQHHPLPNGRPDLRFLRLRKATSTRKCRSRC